MNGWYRAQIAVGGHTWDVTYNPDADPDPPVVLAGMRFGWARPESAPWPAAPDESAVFSIIAATRLLGIREGAPVAIRVFTNPAGPFAPADAPWSFYGRLSDAAAVRGPELPIGSTLRYDITATGHLAWQDAPIGLEPWPAESAQARWERVMSAGGYTAELSAVGAAEFFAPRDGSAATTLADQVRENGQVAVDRYVLMPYAPDTNVMTCPYWGRVARVVHPYANDAGLGRADGAAWVVDRVRAYVETPPPATVSSATRDLAFGGPNPAQGIIDAGYVERVEWSRARTLHPTRYTLSYTTPAANPRFPEFFGYSVTLDAPVDSPFPVEQPALETGLYVDEGVARHHALAMVCTAFDSGNPRDWETSGLRYHLWRNPTGLPPLMPNHANHANPDGSGAWTNPPTPRSPTRPGPIYARTLIVPAIDGPTPTGRDWLAGRPTSVYFEITPGGRYHVDLTLDRVMTPSASAPTYTEPTPGTTTEVPPAPHPASLKVSGCPASWTFANTHPDLTWSDLNLT